MPYQQPTVALSFQIDRTSAAHAEFKIRFKSAKPIVPYATQLPTKDDLVVAGQREHGFETNSKDIFWIDRSSACPRLQIRSLPNIANAGIFTGQLPLSPEDLATMQEKGIMAVLPKFYEQLEEHRKESLAQLAIRKS